MNRIKSTRWIIVALVAASSIFAACSSQSISHDKAWAEAGAEFHLTLLFNGENHGQWEPFGKYSQGGIARRATLVKEFRAKTDNLLLLDSGDTTQGTLFYAYYKGEAGRRFYNLLGYDVVALGNHEMDHGPKILAETFLHDNDFDVVCANIDLSTEPSLNEKVRPYVIKEFGDHKVAIVGLITEEVTFLSRPGPTVKILPPVETAQRVVAELRKQGIENIVILSHLGYQGDLEVGKHVSGVDVIVGGHTETLLGDQHALPEFMNSPDGPYPTVVQAPDGLPVLIVHTHSRGRLLGHLEVGFDKRGVPVRWEGRPIFVGKKIKDDVETTELLEELRKPLDEFKKKVVGVTTTHLDGDRRTVRNKESNLANLVADAMLWETSADKTRVAMINGGVIRASIPKGDVTRGQIMGALPFDNTLVQLDLTGETIVKALEHGVSAVSFTSGGESGGGWLHVAGLQVDIDLTRPIGKRVVAVRVRANDGQFEPIDPEASYRSVITDYMLDGGDGFTSFADAKNIYLRHIVVSAALAEHLVRTKTVGHKAEGRLNITAPGPSE